MTLGALCLALLAQATDAGVGRAAEDVLAERVLKVLLTPLAEPQSARATFEPSWGPQTQVDAPPGGYEAIERELRRRVLEGPATLVVLTLDTRLAVAPGRAALQAVLAFELVPELRFAGPTNTPGQPMPAVLALQREVPPLKALSTGQVRAVQQGAQGEIRPCYQKLLADNALEGELVVELEVLADGQVGQARVAHSSLSVPGVDRCVLAAVKRVRFPALRGAQRFTVRWPFKFQKGADKPPPPMIRK